MTSFSQINFTEINVGRASILSISPAKSAVATVKFDIPFSGIPKVVFAPTYIDGVCKSDTLNYAISASNLTKTGMDIVVSIGRTYENNLFTVDYTAIYHRLSNPLSPYFGKKVYLHNVLSDTYLRNLNGSVDLSASKKKYEEFTIEDNGKGGINILSIASGKYLCVDKSTGVITHQSKSAVDPTKESIDWTVATTSTTGQYKIIDQWNRPLQAHDSTYSADVNGSVAGEDEWEVVV